MLNDDPIIEILQLTLSAAGLGRLVPQCIAPGQKPVAKEKKNGDPGGELAQENYMAGRLERNHRPVAHGQNQKNSTIQCAGLGLMPRSRGAPTTLSRFNNAS